MSEKLYYTLCYPSNDPNNVEGEVIPILFTGNTFEEIMMKVGDELRSEFFAVGQVEFEARKNLVGGDTASFKVTYTTKLMLHRLYLVRLFKII